MPESADDRPRALQRFCLAHEHAFVVPAEALTERGVEPVFAASLLDCRPR